MTGADVLFYLYGGIACGAALGVVLTQNVVRMTFWLITCLGSTAGLFFLLGADFVGATQLLVYVGGTLVLLIFGVMLTASGPFIDMRTNPGESLLAGVIGVTLLAVLATSFTGARWQAATGTPGAMAHQSTGNRPEAEGSTGRAIGLAFLNVRPDRDLGAPEGRTSAGYLLPFEIASVHLLVVLIGAAYLARAKRRVPTTEP